MWRVGFSINNYISLQIKFIIFLFIEHRQKPVKLENFLNLLLPMKIPTHCKIVRNLIYFY